MKRNLVMDLTRPKPTVSFQLEDIYAMIRNCEGFNVYEKGTDRLLFTIEPKHFAKLDFVSVSSFSSIVYFYADCNFILEEQRPKPSQYVNRLEAVEILGVNASMLTYLNMSGIFSPDLVEGRRHLYARTKVEMFQTDPAFRVLKSKYRGSKHASS